MVHVDQEHDFAITWSRTFCPTRTADGYRLTDAVITALLDKLAAVAVEGE
ncbi:hypothetical protein KGQ19_06430 [Catenulispora sp. NL8]|uniref:Uncharacterized protein n=1 Tax=Catenulispora pinistramenti TaxID=2705254 RepID=A0ABS5KJD6_9ACTN|nr:hypothetical protein [Catenulispora pinistramenti]MBS2546498.1 hypothetical protein [Catenulispora pinistramenti]